jgi:heme a synthase
MAASPLAASRLLRLLVLSGLLLALALTAISAHIRLVNSGLGCTDWPACYGQIAAQGAMAPEIATIQRAPAWASNAHRVLASTLGLIALGIAATAAAVTPRALRGPLALLGVVAGLAVLGTRTGGLHQPGVVTANFAGGVALVGLLWWLVLAHWLPRRSALPALRAPALLALLLLLVQGLLGILVSAQFAGLGCTTLPHCDGAWPAALPWERMFLVLEIDGEGRVVAGEHAATLHMLHRAAALPLLGALAWLGVRAWRAGLTGATAGVALLGAGAALLGAASVRSGLASGVVLAHSSTTVLLLIVLLSILRRARPAPLRSLGSGN